MKLNNVKRVTKEDISKAAKGDKVPEWIDALLDPINSFIEQATNALNGGLTFKDNFLCKEHTQNFEGGVAYKINPAIDGKSKLAVSGVLAMDTNGAEVDAFLWEKLNDGNVQVTFTFSNAVTKKCTILLLLRSA